MVTQVNSTNPRYRDLNLSFIPNPVTGDIAFNVGDQAVIKAVENLVLLNFYEKPFHPEIGSSVRNLLFENATPLTAQRIKKAIIQVITNFEPRVALVDVIVQSNPDANRFDVWIQFYIKNNAQPVAIQIFLSRVR